MDTVAEKIVEFDPFAGAAIERVMPTSQAQREVWLADQLSSQASLAFNESVSLRLRGQLDKEAIQGALKALVARHDALRTTLGPDGTQLFVNATAALAIDYVDLSGESPARREAVLRKAAVEAVQTPFDLVRGPLLRAALYRLDGLDHVLLMTVHHIVCDGWSWGLITEDLGALYAELIGSAPGPEPAPSYADYVQWEAAQAGTPEMAEHEAFWLGRFSGSSLPVLDLTTDRPRPAVRTFNSERLDFLLDAGLMADVRKLGAKIGVSVFGTLFSGFAVLLHRLSGAEDIVIGVPSAGQSASGLTGLVGHCVNLLPVRTAVAGAMAFDQFVRQSGTTLLDAFDHQILTYGSLLKKLPLRREPSRMPLVSVMFNVDQAVSNRSSAFPDIDVEFASNARRFENFELFINATPRPDGLSLECQYNTDLFDAATIETWIGAYGALLRSAVAQPALPIRQLQLLNPAQRDALRALQPAATVLAADALMHSAFLRQSAATPDRVALRSAEFQLTYRALDERSNRLAQTLRKRGIGRGERVGLCLSRGNEMVVALLGVLKAGATYVPLDPAFPQARLAYYAEDAQLALLISESTVTAAPTAWRADSAGRILLLDGDRSWLDASPDPLPPGPADATPACAAYIIYTSGSTGKPKGVCLPHSAVANFLASMVQEPGISADDKLAAVTTLSFDIAVLELMLPLSVGAQVVIVPRETAMDGNLLFGLLESSGATMMQATPGMWRMLLDTAWDGGRGFKALVGGESLPPDLAHDLVERTGELWNMYGPTETTVWSTVWHVSRAAAAQRGMSIGRPIANTSVWILDQKLQPCPIGVPGEICIGGDGVALGYLDHPELTADRFVVDPFNKKEGARLYRTGDRGRWRNDGLLEHLGRLDFQVKVRGYRIELGEIEAGCNEMIGVTQSIVLAREDIPGDVRLVAYLTVREGATVDQASLRAHLRTRLPEYMLPQHLVVLESIPLLPNGKVDRKALPAPDKSHMPAAAARVAPRNELERDVLAAMEAVLNLPGLGVHDDFFALGGHSLLAARLTSQLNRDLDLNLPLRTLFESSTAEKLAVAVAATRSSNTVKRKPLVHVPGRKTAPLTPAQERIRFVEELQPGRVVYNTPSAHRLTGPLDRAKFELALREVVQRQSVLRTTIAQNPERLGHIQVIHDSIDFALPFEDLSDLPQVQREPEMMRRMQLMVDTPMDIHAAPLFRIALYKLADDVHGFLFMPHHIIWDGWSFDLLYDEMSAAYGALVEGRANPLPAPNVTYADYAQWYADWMDGPEFETQLAFWKARFKKAPMPKAPKPDRPRNAGMTGEGASEWVHLDHELTERLREIARSAGATLNMLTMSVYTVMMANVVDSGSIVIGIPVRGRLMTEVEPIMGLFNNMLPVQLQVDAERQFVDFVRGIKQELLEVFSNQDIPFERLAAEPEVAARSQKVGLYQALFSFQDARGRKRQWGNLSQQGILIFQKGATEDLGLWLMELSKGMEGGFTYNADIYTAATAAAFRERFVELLQRLAVNPQLTISELASRNGSTSAQYLLRLAPDALPSLAASPPASAVGTRSGAGLRDLSPSGRALAEIWAALLCIDVEQVASQDNFFELGGTSLLAMQAVSQMEARLGRSVPARRYVFESLGQLAAAYDDSGARQAPIQPTGTPAPASAQGRGVLGRLARLVRGS